MDRLSEVPDAVLVHVLSFLPTKDAVKTTILSKRFENQWISVPNLIFHHNNSTIKFANQALVLWGGAKNRQINKLDIEFTSAAIDFRLWVRFAVDHGVEHLRLVFANSSWGNSASYFTLPQHLYSNASIETLELGCCVLSSSAKVDWCRLKKLSMKCVRLSNELIKILISGSVQLELFEISDCKGYDSLDLGCSSLKILKIKDNFEDSDTPITISAPNITKLCISGVWYRKITVVCLSALVDAELRFAYRTKYVEYRRNYQHVTSFNYHVNQYVEKVVEQLHCHLSIERLVIGTMFIEAITLAEVKTLPPQLSKCRSFTLCTCTETNVLKGILNLLKMLANLEVLILDMEFFDNWYPSGSDVENFLASEVKDCRFIFQNLKVVKMTCHLDRRPALPFIKFILEHTRSLETMSIFPKTASSYSIDYMFQLIKGLSDMPRSSPIAKVLLWKGQTKIQVEMNSFNFAMYHLPSDACPSKRPRTPQRPNESDELMDSKKPV